MKKLLILFVFPVLFFVVSCNGSKTLLSKQDLKKQAQTKVSEMQQLIHFDDAQAEQLVKLEFRHALELQKAHNCYLCNSEKRIEKLEAEKAEELQRILTREQYIKYDAVENKRIKKYPLWAE